MHLLYCSKLNYTYIEFIHKALGKSVNRIPVDRKVNRKAIGAQWRKCKRYPISSQSFTELIVIVHWCQSFTASFIVIIGSLETIRFTCHENESSESVLCSRWHDHATISVHSGCQRSFVFSRYDLIQCCFHHLGLWGIKHTSSLWIMRWHFVESVRTNKTKLLYIWLLRVFIQTRFDPSSSE